MRVKDLRKKEGDMPNDEAQAAIANNIANYAQFLLSECYKMYRARIMEVRGRAIDADDGTLPLGESCRCMSVPFEEDGKYFTIVKTSTGEMLFCRFRERPVQAFTPIKLEKDRIVFHPCGEPFPSPKEKSAL